MKGIVLEIVFWVIAFIACVMLSTGAVSGFLNVKDDMAKRNGTYGSISYVDVYEDFNAYDITLDDVIFYKTANGYSYTKEFNTVLENFDGTADKYNLLVNNAPCNYTTSNAARLRGIWLQSFRDFDGNHVCDIALDIRFTFSVSKIILTIDTNVSAEHFGYLAQYVQVNGMRLRIIDEQYNPVQQTAATNFELEGELAA